MKDILKEKDIRKKCALTSTFTKGSRLCQQDQVYSLSLKKISDTEIKVIAQVEGSYGNQYDVDFQLKINDKKPTIGQCSCNCQAFAGYSGICKHLVATMLEFNYQMEEWELEYFLDENETGALLPILREGKDVMEELEEDGEVLISPDPFGMLDKILETYHSAETLPAAAISTSSGKTFSTGTPPAASSKELLDAMSSIVLQDRNRFCLENTSGDINLEVTLNIKPNEENIELRIGKKQMYVVKSLPKLVENIKEQEFVKYGKNLEFVHTQSSFSKDSQPIVSFLLNAKFPADNYYYGYYYGRSTSESRYLKLEPYELDELMELFEGRQLYVHTFQDVEKINMPVIRQDPLLPVSIKGDQSGKKVEINFPEIILLNGVNAFYICWNDQIYICSEDFCRGMKEVVKLMAVNWVGEERERNHYTSRKVPLLELCEKDYLSFCATLLPLLERYMDVTIQEVDFSKYQMEEGRFDLYFDLLENQDVICDAKVIYGDKEHNLVYSAQLSETYRDIKSEYEIRTLLGQYLPEKTNNGQTYLLRNDDDRLAALVEDGVEQFKNLADVYVSEAFKKIRIANKVTITTGLSIKGNLLNISWDISGMSSEELYDILGSYRHKKKYHRLENGELLNISSSGLEIFADMQEDLRITKSQLKSGMADVPLYRSLYMDTLMKENTDKIKAARDEQFMSLIEKFDTVSKKQYELPVQVTAELRPYQMEGYQWVRVLAELGFGGILADDMGLGKTLQMIAYLCSADGPHLVVCPASLVYNWEAEFHKFAPSTKVCLMAGNAAERQELIKEYKNYDVIVTSYDLLKRDIDMYTGKEFGCEIIDEAQYIKNPSTQAAKAVKAIESRNRFALTGTPIENRLSELWSIFEYLMPGYLYSYKHFKETFEEHIVQGSEESENTALARLHSMIKPFLLRRLKKDVLKDLPEKLEEVVFTRFAAEQEKLYKATEKHIITNLRKKSNQEFKENKLQILAEITKLREICCDPALLYENYKKGSAKLETCLELIENAIEGGHKILLFSQFASMLDILKARLKEKRIKTLQLTGSTSKVKRREMVQQFQEGRGDVFLISLKAGGTGLNLTAADVVIHYDPWWNVAAQNQATDRAHRIGQEKNVTVMKLIVKNTIEERIVTLQEKKQDLADKIISGESVSMSSLSREELLSLFNE
ncbi:MAG: ATP-dependent helicase [Lachnospiraceae bacterium]|nr:ATP-dependent helicase [Lachnospiraceae bacterium]